MKLLNEDYCWTIVVKKMLRVGQCVFHLWSNLLCTIIYKGSRIESALIINLFSFLFLFLTQWLSIVFCHDTSLAHWLRDARVMNYMKRGFPISVFSSYLRFFFLSLMILYSCHLGWVPASRKGCHSAKVCSFIDSLSNWRVFKHFKITPSLFTAWSVEWMFLEIIF